MEGHTGAEGVTVNNIFVFLFYWGDLEIYLLFLVL